MNYLRSIKALYDRTSSYSALLNACREASNKAVRAGDLEASRKALSRLERQLQRLKSPTDCPKGAIGFDYHGATFTRVNNKVTFEVVSQTFGLCGDEGISRVGDLVHYIDVGGLAVDEAAGVEAVVRGLHVQHPDDDELLNGALPLFDSLYADGRVQP